VVEVAAGVAGVEVEVEVAVPEGAEGQVLRLLNQLVLPARLMVPQRMARRMRAVQLQLRGLLRELRLLLPPKPIVRASQAEVPLPSRNPFNLSQLPISVTF
jgi:hypothetical protein